MTEVILMRHEKATPLTQQDKEPKTQMTLDAIALPSISTAITNSIIHNSIGPEQPYNHSVPGQKPRLSQFQHLLTRFNLSRIFALLFSPLFVSSLSNLACSVLSLSFSLFVSSFSSLRFHIPTKLISPCLSHTPHQTFFNQLANTSSCTPLSCHPNSEPFPRGDFKRNGVPVIGSKEVHRARQRSFAV